MSSPSVRKNSAGPLVLPESQSFPQFRRLRKRAEFQRVYAEGTRVNSALFSVFCRGTGSSQPGRMGLTVPGRLGNAVLRNRLKRRLRELIRLHWAELPDGCDLVLHVRRPTVDAGRSALEREIVRVFREAAKSKPREARAPGAAGGPLRVR